jgi:hypothetical protein
MDVGAKDTHSMTLPHRPSAVIFDMDGLLFDTEALWQEALLSAAAEGGHEIPNDVFNKSVGVRRSQCKGLFLSHFGEDFLFDDFHANWSRHFWLIAENKLALKPGTPELLEILDQFRLPRAIATSSSRTTVERHLTSHSLIGSFRPDCLPWRLRKWQTCARSISEGCRTAGGRASVMLGVRGFSCWRKIGVGGWHDDRDGARSA